MKHINEEDISWENSTISATAGTCNGQFILLDNGGELVEEKLTPYEQMKPWQRFIMYSFMTVITIAFVIAIILGSAKFGLMLWSDYKHFGWLGIWVFIIGSLGMGLLWIVVNFTMAVVRRILKWKWLQIPIE